MPPHEYILAQDAECIHSKIRWAMTVQRTFCKDFLEAMFQQTFVIELGTAA